MRSEEIHRESVVFTECVGMLTDNIFPQIENIMYCILISWPETVAVHTGVTFHCNKKQYCNIWLGQKG